MFEDTSLFEYTSLSQARKKSEFVDKFYFHKLLKHVFAGLIGFCMSAWLIHQIVPSPKIPQNVADIGPKYAYYLAHKDQYDTLFFGSSRVERHIIPEIFDEVAADNQLATTSFNFGIGGLKPIPQYVLMREVLKHPPTNLKWVFLEQALGAPDERLVNAKTNRSIYWHSLSNTLLGIDYTLRDIYASQAKKAQLVLYHLLSSFYHHVNLGRASYQWLKPSPELIANDENSSVTWENGEYNASDEGYKSYDGQISEPRSDFLDHLDSYHASVEDLAETIEKSRRRVHSERIGSNHTRLLRKILAQVKQVGATPVFVVGPALYYEGIVQPAYRQGKIPHLISFNDPAEYPDLFKVAYRYDKGHLNHPGAQYFSKLLATKFAHIFQPA